MTIFKTGYTLSLDINVMEEVPTIATPSEEKPAAEISTIWIILGVLAIIIVIIIIYFILKKRKEMPEEAKPQAVK